MVRLPLRVLVLADQYYGLSYTTSLSYTTRLRTSTLYYTVENIDTPREEVAGCASIRPVFSGLENMATKATDIENRSEVQQRNLQTARHTIVYNDIAEAFENSLSRTLGLDGEGSVHTFDAATSTVTVINQFGRVEWVEELAANGRTVAAWEAFIAQKRGWL